MKNIDLIPVLGGIKLFGSTRTNKIIYGQIGFKDLDKTKKG